MIMMILMVGIMMIIISVITNQPVCLAACQTSNELSEQILNHHHHHDYDNDFDLQHDDDDFDGSYHDYDNDLNLHCDNFDGNNHDDHDNYPNKPASIPSCLSNIK